MWIQSPIIWRALQVVGLRSWRTTLLDPLMIKVAIIVCKLGLKGYLKCFVLPYLVLIMLKLICADLFTNFSGECVFVKMLVGCCFLLSLTFVLPFSVTLTHYPVKLAWTLWNAFLCELWTAPCRQHSFGWINKVCQDPLRKLLRFLKTLMCTLTLLFLASFLPFGLTIVPLIRMPRFGYLKCGNLRLCEISWRGYPVGAWSPLLFGSMMVSGFLLLLIPTLLLCLKQVFCASWGSTVINHSFASLVYAPCLMICGNLSVRFIVFLRNSLPLSSGLRRINSRTLSYLEEKAFWSTRKGVTSTVNGESMLLGSGFFVLRRLDPIWASRSDSSVFLVWLFFGCLVPALAVFASSYMFCIWLHGIHCSSLLC